MTAPSQASYSKPSASRSAIMRQVRGKDNKLELAIRDFLKAKRFHYEIYASLPGKPDIILPRRKVALRIMGCFWHGHSCKRGNRKPKTNPEYWHTKITNNKIRDRRTRKELIALGWLVIDVWECHVKKPNFYERLLAKLGTDNKGVIGNYMDGSNRSSSERQ